MLHRCTETMYRHRIEIDLGALDLDDYSKLGWELVSTHNIPMSARIAYVLKKDASAELPPNANEIEILKRIQKRRYGNRF